MSQMHFARKGWSPKRCVYVADREKIAPELVRSRSGCADG